MTATGIFLIIVGVIVTAAFMSMDVSVHGEVVNLDRLNVRLCGVIIGTGAFLAGILLLGVGVIYGAITGPRDSASAVPSSGASDDERSDEYKTITDYLTWRSDMKGPRSKRELDEEE